MPRISESDGNAATHPTGTMHWLNRAYLIPVVEPSTHASGHECRGAHARSRVDAVDWQVARGMRAGARLHRAATAGADHERGAAHGRRGHRPRRGNRRGDALRARAALRSARRCRVHRRRRLRHPPLRQPPDGRLDGRRPLRNASPSHVANLLEVAEVCRQRPAQARRAILCKSQSIADKSTCLSGTFERNAEGNAGQKEAVAPRAGVGRAIFRLQSHSDPAGVRGGLFRFTS